MPILTALFIHLCQKWSEIKKFEEIFKFGYKIYFICLIISPKTPNETVCTQSICSLSNVLQIIIAKVTMPYFEDVMLGFKCHNPDKVKPCWSRKSRVKSLGLLSLLEKSVGGKDMTGEMEKTKLDS